MVRRGFRLLNNMGTLILAVAINQGLGFYPQ